MRWTHQLLLLGAVTLCTCAFPTFEFEDEDDGSGGAPTTTSASTSVTGGGGATSTGGAAPGCDLLDPSDTTCTAGTKCGVLDQETGAVGCVEAGTRPIWSRCDADAECAPGLFCDTVTHICRPFCSSANNCPSNVAKCIDAPKSGGGGAIPGVKVCTAHCQPMSGVPCDNSSGPTTCFFDTQLVETDCGATANAAFYAACSSVLDCKRGALCVTYDSQANCREVCTNPGGANQSNCALDEYCAHTNPQLDYDGVTFGICLPLF